MKNLPFQHISATFAKKQIEIRSLLSTQKASVLSSAYILSNFNYCSLVWMFCCKDDNNLIFRTQKRVLRAVNLDFTTTGDTLLEKYKAESVHTYNLRALAIEVYKSINHLNPSFMWDLFVPKIHP